MAVAIISYRRYPDGNVQDQVDDIELASKAIATKFPNILRQPDTVSNQDWMGTTLMGHSSGTHVALMAMVQRIERWATAFSAGVPEVEKFNQSAIHFDQVVGLSGVYSIRDHYHFEVSRGVEQISPMKPAAGYTTDAFSAYSPIERLAKTSSLALVQQQQADLLPDIFLLHGMRDDVVPFTGVNRAERVLRGIGYEKLSAEFLDIGHQETVMHLMFGGLTKDVVLGWLQRRPQRNEEGIFYV
jgi:prenylcysteine alpha-carboxyl methylesterase